MTTNQEKPLKSLLRLNKVLARHGLCSRRQADEWIQAGRISVDGIVCRELGTQVNPENQNISVDGKLLKEVPSAYYILLYKPKGVLTTRSDPQGRPIVMDLLPKELVKAGVFPVGRLDNDSEGLLLLTNDGDWSQILLHPSHQIWKEYLVRTNKPLTPEQKIQLEGGVKIDKTRTLPARISINNQKYPQGIEFTICIREGKNRQIRRMCKEIGLWVVSLKRLKMGPISLGKLKIGSWRFLTNNEIKAIQQTELELNQADSTT